MTRWPYIFILMLMMSVSWGPPDSVDHLAPTKRGLSKHALFLLWIPPICLCVPCSLLSMLRTHALTHGIQLFLKTTIVNKPVSSILARTDTRGCNRCRPRLHDVIRVIINLIRRLLDFLHLHIQLIRQLLKLATRIWRH